MDQEFCGLEIDTPEYGVAIEVAAEEFWQEQRSKQMFDRQSARRWMRNNAEDYRDPLTGEVGATELAEACAGVFEVNDVGGPLDDETHWIWELALEVG